MRPYFVADGERGWAVGDTTVATIDGGKSWFPQNSGTDVVLWSVYFAAEREPGQQKLSAR
jgi:hypothetical protein